MTQLTGIKDAEYLAQFLGKKIAIKGALPSQFYVFPLLAEIHYDKTVKVKDSEGTYHTFTWSACESPYVILMEKDVVMR
jgi:hypothetical protein